MKKSTLFLTAVAVLTLNLKLETLNCFAQFSFVRMTDLHVSDAVSYVNGCDLNGITAQCYLTEFANLNPKPAFVIATGDISNIGNITSDGMYPTFTQFLFPQSVISPGIGAYFIDSAKTIPIYFTPGNHDYKTSLAPPLQLSVLNYYSAYIAPDTDYAVTINNAVILFMRSGNEGPYWNDLDPLNSEGSGISDAQCHWLRNILSSNSNKRKIIVMHHPTVDVAGTNSDGSPFTGTIL